MLYKAHKDLIAPEKTPSGYSNKYSLILYAFPAAFQVTGLGHILDTIVGRIRFDNAFFIRDLKVLFGVDNTALKAYITTFRNTVKEKYQT